MINPLFIQASYKSMNWSTPSTNVVEFVLEPEALLDHPVAPIKQVASAVFDLLLKIADLGG